MSWRGAGSGCNDLWSTIETCSQHALDSGSLQPIRTREEIINHCGVNFIARVVSSLAQKDNDRKRRTSGAVTGQTADPFLPHEPDLFVADISDSHFCLLNKFSVIEHHVLIVTRRFEQQETLLNLRDFEALWACMIQFDSLGFYNGGAAAGASQPHKHLQLVPLPLSWSLPAVPIGALLAADPGATVVAGLPFLHAVAWLELSINTDPLEAARICHGHYMTMLDRVGIQGIASADGLIQSLPYNLLVTRNWMLLIPRIREHFETISINALGYAGSFFLRDARELQRVSHAGPMNILQAVAISRT